MSEQKDLGKSKELIEAVKEVESNPELAKLTPIEKSMIEEDAIDERDASEMIAAETRRKKRDVAMKIAKSKTNPEAPEEIHVMRPTWGLSTAEVTIHSRPAYNLLAGRKKGNPITGLYAAASRVRNVAAAYRKGCFYAAHFLIKLEQDMKHSNDALERKKIELENSLRAKCRLKLRPFEANSPAVPEFVFVSPYAYHLLELLLQFDEIVRLILPYKQNQFLNASEYESIVREAGKHVRRCFSICDTYYFVGLKAYKNKNDLWLAAEQQFGVLDAEIISRKKLPNLVTLPAHLL